MFVTNLIVFNLSNWNEIVRNYFFAFFCSCNVSVKTEYIHLPQLSLREQVCVLS